MKPKKYHLDLYNFDIFYFLGWDKKDFAEYCTKRYGIEVPSKYAKAETTFIYEGDPKCILIWLSSKDNNGHTLTHEIKHAVSYIHEWVGIKPDHRNDEAEAYLQGLLFKKSGAI